MKSSDYRPTKDTKRPRTDDGEPDEKDTLALRLNIPYDDASSDGKDGSPPSPASAAPAPSKPTYLATTVPFPTSEICGSASLRAIDGSEE